MPPEHRLNIVGRADVRRWSVVRTLPKPDVDDALRVSPDVPWVTIVWNDPVNLMTYVSFVFRSYFGYAREEADRLMLQVHNNGRAVVATGNREQMERHVSAMHGYGLQASVAKADA